MIKQDMMQLQLSEDMTLDRRLWRSWIRVEGISKRDKLGGRLMHCTCFSVHSSSSSNFLVVVLSYGFCYSSLFIVLQLSH